MRALIHRLRGDMALLGLGELLVAAAAIHGLTLASLPGLGSAQVNPAAAIALAIVAAAAILGFYHRRICHDPKRLLITATMAGLAASPVILWMGDPEGGNPAWLLEVLGIWLAVACASRLSFGLFLRYGGLTRRVLVLGDGDRAHHLLGLLARHHGRMFEAVPMSRDQADLSPAALRRDRIWAVVTVGAEALADPPPGVVVLSDTDFQERHLGRIDATVAAGFEAGPVASLGKRLFDVIMSLLLLALTLPLMAFTAMAIACDSPGSVLYRQTRIGLAGRPFMLLKFRSMTADAEAGGQPRWAQKHDPRVTRVGRFIRQTRIDELPQLLNVLRGDMSLVGPRPERPHFVGELAREIPGYETRTRVKPGITGWAQVNYPYGASVEDAREKHAYDLYYLKHRGFLLDLLILFGTVRVILFGEGAR